MPLYRVTYEPLRAPSSGVVRRTTYVHAENERQAQNQASYDCRRDEHVISVEIMPSESATTRLSDFKVGDRVELSPALDLWMRGARFGNVVKIGRTYVHVALDRLPGEPRRIRPQYLNHARV